MPIDPQFLADDIQIIDQDIVFQGYFQVKRYKFQHALFAGGQSDVITREVFMRGNAAAALPYDPIRDQVVLIEQVRIPALADYRSPWLLEIVAGIFDKDNESAADIARRETEEEAGLDVIRLQHICDYWVSPGGSDEQVVLFCAQIDAAHAGGVYGLSEEHEDIKVHVLSRSEAYDAVIQGHINNAASIIALQWLALNHTQVREIWLD